MGGGRGEERRRVPRCQVVASVSRGADAPVSAFAVFFSAKTNKSRSMLSALAGRARLLLLVARHPRWWRRGGPGLRLPGAAVGPLRRLLLPLWPPTQLSPCQSAQNGQIFYAVG